jgi:hypothetical protein
MIELLTTRSPGRANLQQRFAGEERARGETTTAVILRRPAQRADFVWETATVHPQ